MSSKPTDADIHACGDRWGDKHVSLIITISSISHEL